MIDIIKENKILVLLYLSWYLITIFIDTILVYLLYGCLDIVGLPNLSLFNIFIIVFIFRVLTGDVDNYVGSLYSPTEEDEDGSLQ